MTRSFALPAGVVLLFATPCLPQATAEIKLIARGEIPGKATDRSGLADLLKGGIPHNRLGGLGGAIAFTGHGNRYVLAPDAGPGDGLASYRCRLHFVDIACVGDRLQLQLVDTVLLHDKTGEPFVSRDAALTVTKSGVPQRLDIEGIRVARNGTFFISDEYGPVLYEFDRSGRRLRSLEVPGRFRVAYPHADPARELELNKRGRVPNRGFEGLAITPDGRKLIACLQNPLIQDGGRLGTNVRLLEIDVATQATREFLYPLQSPKHGISEIVAINQNEFLVLERDAKGKFCQLIKIDLTSATDVSGRDVLPARGVPAGTKAVTQAVFLDLFDARFGLAEEAFMRNIEGLTFGPDLPDGRHLLLVSNDNDLSETTATHVLAFAIDPADLPTFQPQRHDGK